MVEFKDWNQGGQTAVLPRELQLTRLFTESATKEQAGESVRVFSFVARRVPLPPNLRRYDWARPRLHSLQSPEKVLGSLPREVERPELDPGMWYIYGMGDKTGCSTSLGRGWGWRSSRVTEPSRPRRRPSKAPRRSSSGSCRAPPVKAPWRQRSS